MVAGAPVVCEFEFSTYYFDNIIQYLIKLFKLLGDEQESTDNRHWTTYTILH